MKNCLITFRSVTPAQRGEGILRRSGYQCSLRRTPRWMEEQGCGYSLQVRYEDVVTAVDVLRSHGILFRKIYLWQDGQAQELNL